MRILSDGLNDVLAVAEMYYRHKGNRLSTRQQSIHETFDLCADALVERIQSYRLQVDEYHNNCVLEVQAQVKKFNEVIITVPDILFADVTHLHENQVSMRRDALEKEYKPKLAVLEDAKLRHYTLLRPTLGHPQNENELTKLCSAESEREKNLRKLIEQYYTALKDLDMEEIEKTTGKLVELTDTLFEEAEQLVAVEDIVVRVPKQVQLTERQMLRAKMRQNGADIVGVKEESSVLSAIDWPGLSSPLEFIRDVRHVNFDRQITANKPTPYHQSVVEARDAAFTSVTTATESRLNGVTSWKQTIVDAEQRWRDNWITSVDKINGFY